MFVAPCMALPYDVNWTCKLPLRPCRDCVYSLLRALIKPQLSLIMTVLEHTEGVLEGVLEGVTHVIVPHASCDMQVIKGVRHISLYMQR